MDGLYIHKKGQISLETGTSAGGLKLIAQTEGMEVMHQSVSERATMWISPAEDRDTVEFFYILNGCVEMKLEGTPEKLGPGDSFYADGLREEVLLRATEPTELLYFTNKPMFDSLFGFQDDLLELVNRIDEKDNYTCTHSRDVMEYSVEMVRRMGLEGSITIDNIVVASLFHDVGKCFVPDEVLKDHKELEPAQARLIMKHPTDGGRLLRAHYNKQIVEIVRSHHERMDGSGYPMGLMGDEISLEARIVAVADCFDAMTTDRGYNEPMTFEAAAESLSNQSDKFDAKVLAALREMAADGTAEMLYRKVRGGA